jgi:hypothetical protein
MKEKLYTEQIFFKRTKDSKIETIWLTWNSKWHAQNRDAFKRVIKQQIGEVSTLWG